MNSLEQKINDRRLRRRKRKFTYLGLAFLLSNSLNCATDPRWALKEKSPKETSDVTVDALSNSYDSNYPEHIDSISHKDQNESAGCPTPYYDDKDGDGYGNFKVWVCENIPGYVKNKEDCNDFDPLTNPEVADLCGEEGDGLDNNCNGQIDEDKIPQYSEVCFNGELYWVDSCGNKEGVIETCVGNTNCSITCMGNTLYYQNECGGIENSITPCKIFEECINGECICKPPYCTTKECGDDSRKGSYGECGVCQKCSDDGKCKEYTIEEMLTKSICSLTDSVSFSLGMLDHNFKTNCTDSSNFVCPGYEGIKCSKDQWVQVDLNVEPGSEVLILSLFGKEYFSQNDGDNSSSLQVKLDQNPLIENNFNDTSQSKILGIECGLPSEGYLFPLIKGIDITTDGKVVADLQSNNYNHTSIYSLLQMYSCSCPKNE